MSFFQDHEGNWSSKRFIGIFGMLLIHLCYAYRVIAYGDTSDTLVMVTADTALLGVEAVTNVFNNNEDGDKQYSNKQDQAV